MDSATPPLLTELPLLESLFDYYSDRLGRDQTAYRNHVYRVINYTAALKSLTEEELTRLQIAGFFHDVGIWLAGTFDYLVPSARLAVHYLEQNELLHWQEEIESMILNHHKISSLSPEPDNLPEAFRRADWIDVSMGSARFGIPRTYIRAVKQKFPNAGFHRLLLKLSGKQMVMHPLHPLPMFKR